VVAGLKSGRESDRELIVDMNIGMGVEDVVVAERIVGGAFEKDTSQKLPL
jgi:ornithine cyclodeaminase/alanine dehydrogenase-like protein (mu-crystallin family)